MYLNNFYFTFFLYLIVRKGAEASCSVNQYPTSYLRWLQQIRHIPGTNWLHKPVVVSLSYFPNYVQPTQSKLPCHLQAYQRIYQRPISYGNDCSQISPHFVQPAQYHFRQAMIPSQMTKSPPNYIYPMVRQVQQPIQRQSYNNFHSQTAERQPIYRYSPEHGPMMCIPVNFGTLERHEELQGDEGEGLINDENDEEQPENEHTENIITQKKEHEEPPKIEHNSISPKTEHVDPPKIEHVEIEKKIIPSPPIAPPTPQPAPTTHSSPPPTPPPAPIPVKVNPVKKEGRRRRRRRRGPRPPRVNKKIGRAFLKALHTAEDVAASGALGPQMKAAANAAKAAETAISGAIKGESAAEIARKTAMTAANAAMGGSMKAQMMSQVAAQAGVPVPAEMSSGGGGSAGGPLAMAGGGGGGGGGSLKQKLMKQAAQQAVGMAMAEAAKHSNANANQPGQASAGP